MHDFPADSWDPADIELSPRPEENTRRYLTHILGKCAISAENIHSVLNLACGFGYESPVLEDLFPNADIIAIDKEDYCFGNLERCRRTKALQVDLNEPKSWKNLPKADLIVLQQPQLSWWMLWESHQMYIDHWMPKIFQALNPNGICIVCLMCPADLEWFYESDLYGGNSPSTAAGKYFDTILDEENPHGTLGDMYYLMAFRKKDKNKHPVAKTQKKIGHILRPDL